MAMLALALTLPLCGVAVAQDAAPGSEPGAAAADVAADAKVATGGSAPAVDPAAAQALQAIVMDVQGKARWRAGPDAEWHEAKVNDLLDPGAEVRTGLRSRVTMRVGRNATVLVDSGTSFSLSELVAEGQTLRTTAAVKTGRVDFKVDKVGFANDFKVVTPQTTLSVRGTGFSLATGALNGFEISGARTNAMNAIELRYAVDNARFFLSGNAQSTSQRQEPAQNAWLNTVGPPPIVGLLANNQQLVQQVAQGTAGNAPTNPQQFQQQNAAESNGAAGAGALMQAADDPDASSSLIDLARAKVVTGALPPTVGSDSGDGSSGGGTATDGETDPLLRQLSDPYLRQELRAARTEVPGLVTDLDVFNYFVDDVIAAADRFEAVFPSDPESDLSARLSQLDVTTADEDRFQRVYDVATEPLSQSDLIQLARTENALDAHIFTMSPFIVVGPGSPGGGGGESAGPASMPSSLNIRDALQNAEDWSQMDRYESFTKLGLVQRALVPDGHGQPEDAAPPLRDMHTLAQRWTFDATVPDENSGQGGPASPLLITLTMNEVVQREWDSAFGALLSGMSGGGVIAAEHARLRSATAALIAEMESQHHGTTQIGLADVLHQYARAASIENTAASQQASIEYAQLISEARAALDDALEGALNAAERSSDARTMAQRVLYQAVSNDYVGAAADIARACQLSTINVLRNAADISENYRDAKERVRGAGVLPPDLNTGGTRPF